MLAKVITILSTSISICVANILQNSGQDRHQPHATSSVNFHRQDVPMAYKYNSFHPHDKVPYSYLPDHTLNPTKLRSIQYAPLLKPGEIQLQNTKFNKVNIYNHQNLLQLDTPQKKTQHLEPKLEELSPVPSIPSGLQHKSYPLSHLDYIPGHNIEVLRSLNRSPGHNAVYRSYTDRSPEADRPNKINHLNQYIVNPSQRIHEYTTKFWINAEASSASTTTTATPYTTTTTPQTTTTTMSYLYPYQQPRQYYIQKPITYIVEKPIAPEKSQYTKMHTLLLNVARSYNLAMAPHRAMHAGANPSLLGQLHSYPSVNKHPVIKNQGSTELRAPLIEQKTYLYPIEKNLHFTLHS